MNIISLITFRYIRGSRVFGLLSLKSRLSFIVMMVGVSLLIVVLSIFNGFQRQVKESLWSGGPHITIENTQGSGEIQKYERVIELLLQNPTLNDRIISMQGNITSHGLLQNNNTFVPVMIRAVPIPNEEELLTNQVSNFPKLEYYNRDEIKDLNKRNLVVIGKEMSLLYNYNLGRGITLAVPSGSFNVSRGVELNISSFAVTGLFKTGYYNYDSKFIFMSLPTAQKFFKMKNSVNQITVKVKSLDDLQYCKQLILQTISSSDFDSDLRRTSKLSRCSSYGEDNHFQYRIFVYRTCRPWYGCNRLLSCTFKKKIHRDFKSSRTSFFFYSVNLYFELHDYRFIRIDHRRDNRYLLRKQSRNNHRRSWSCHQ